MLVIMPAPVVIKVSTSATFLTFLAFLSTKEVLMRKCEEVKINLFLFELASGGARMSFMQDFYTRAQKNLFVFGVDPLATCVFLKKTYILVASVATFNK
jgi:hypothetical protein